MNDLEAISNALVHFWVHLLPALHNIKRADSGMGKTA
jgi:hypothetical protein